MIKPSKTREEIELKVLADFVSHPGKMGAAVVECGLTKEDFGDPALGETFARLLEAETPDADEDKMMRAFISAMPEKYIANGAGEETMKKASVGSAFVRDDIVSLKWYAVNDKYERDVVATLRNASFNHLEKVQSMHDLGEAYVEFMDRLDVFAGLANEPEDTGFNGTKPTPEKLLNVPGFVNYYADYIYRTAPRPNRVLAFAGALTMLSRLVARKFTDSRNCQPNIYLVALAGSGVGKNRPRVVNIDLCNSAKIYGVGRAFASGQGLEDAMFRSQAILFQVDEFDTVLNRMNDKKDTSGESMYASLLSFFTDSGTTYDLRDRSMTAAEQRELANAGAEKRDQAKLSIYRPSLTMLATAIPELFYKSLSLRALTNGLLARCLIFEAGTRESDNDENLDEPIPEGLVAFAQRFSCEEHKDEWWQRQPQIKIPDEEGVVERRKWENAEFDKLYNRSQRAGDVAGKATWNRCEEIVDKLALLYALSTGYDENTKITVKGHEWAFKLVMYSTKRMLAMVENFVSDSRIEQKCKDLVRFLASFKDHTAKSGELMRKLHLDKFEMERVVATLEAQGDIEIIKGSGKTVFIRQKNAQGRRRQ